MDTKLNQFLADLTILSKKVQNYHWNIQGRSFFSIHSKLDDVYENLNETIDEIAERLLALKKNPISNYKGCLEISNIKEADSVAISIEDALKSLFNDIEYMLVKAKEIKEFSDNNKDYGTSSMIDNFIVEYEKLSWMLRATYIV